MSDEESLNLEDVGAGAEEVESEGRKAGFLPTFVIKILKWVAIGLGFVILGVTTTVVTFSLINRGKTQTGLTNISEEYQAVPEPLEYDDTIDEIRGVTADETPAIFSVRVSLGYEVGNQQVAFELNARRRQIQNLIFIWISGKKREELRPQAYTTLQEELKQQINRIMKDGKIKSVVFRSFVVTQ